MEKGRLNLKSYELLVIGGSAGSLEVVLNLLPQLREGLSIAIIIVLHRKTELESRLSDLLATKTNWVVKEAEEKEKILPGTIYLAPPDYHLLVEKDHTLSLDYSEKIHYCRPAIDATLETAAAAYRSAVAALLLSGANGDGTQGLRKVKECGGLTIVQDPDTAEVPYMPQYAIQHFDPDLIVAANEIGPFINSFG